MVRNYNRTMPITVDGRQITLPALPSLPLEAFSESPPCNCLQQMLVVMFKRQLQKESVQTVIASWCSIRGHCLINRTTNNATSKATSVNVHEEYALPPDKIECGIVMDVVLSNTMHFGQE